MSNQVTVDIDVIKKHQRRGKEHVDKEAKALRLLEENFINEPKIDHYPFPKLISTAVCKEQHKPKRGFSEQCYILTMTYCGINAYKNTQTRYRANNGRLYDRVMIQAKNIHNTVQCIINNLHNLGIMYNDTRPANTCINEKGQISLIDFDKVEYYDKHEELADHYKKPDLIKLKNNLLLDADYLRRFKKAGPWSMLYMWEGVRGYRDKLIFLQNSLEKL